jgi:hypothetical protein
MTAVATPAAVPAEVLHAAREAVLAALTTPAGTSGHHATRDTLAAVPAGLLLDVAALLATMAAGAVITLTPDEWAVLAQRWGVEP